ncbi:hypothetical protein ACMFMF_011557 [Clarireedia jacksonii]
MYDQADSDHHYSTSLIFTHQYLQHGPGFSMEGTVEDAHSKNVVWFNILQGWVKSADSVQSTEGKSAPRSVIQGHMIRALCGALMQNGMPDTATETLYQKVQATMTDNEMTKDISDDIRKELESMQHLGHAVWKAWDRKLDEFTSAMRAGVAHSWDRTVAFPRGGGGVKITVYGDPVKAFMDDFQDLGVFDGTPSDFDRSTRKNIGGLFGGCFRSGTKVLTRDGHEVDIENVTEGLQVLTRAGKQPQWGICSDEVVYQDSGTEETHTLWGINDDVPFFTASHVFHTTTGLRAIDPLGARKENPWVDVGTLQAGHILYHTKDGKSYEKVHVHRLRGATTSVDRVYGLHLREGLRAYHANGYLVHLNYPEITIKSIGQALQSFSIPQRLFMLLAMYEIRPLLDRFGANAMLDRLAIDILDASDTSPLASYAGPDIAADDLYLNDLKRAWEITHETTDNLNNTPCDRVEVYEGLLFVNGDYCPVSSVSGTEVHWRRELNGQWEHGQISFTSAFEIGHGSINVGSQEEMEWGHHTSRISAYASGKSSINLLEQQKVRNRTTDPRLGHLLELSTLSAPLVEENDRREAADNFLSVQPAASETVTAAAQEPIKTLDEAYKYVDNYLLQYDNSPWDDTRTLSAKPENLFHLTTGHDKRTGLRTARIVELDALSNAIHAKSEVATSKLPPELYHCVMSKEDSLVFTVQISKPDLIAAYADGNDHDGELSLKNLSYKNLGLDFTLPFLFSLLEVRPSWNAATMTGFCREFDANIIASCGDRHLISGSWTATPAFPARKAVMTAASAFGSTATGPGTSSPTFLTQARFLAARVGVGAKAPLPADDAIGAQRLCESDLDVGRLKEDTEKMLQNVMLYHMDDEARTTWTSTKKPEVGTNSDQIPEELGPNLTTSTKDWLKKQYIPMWIASRIMNMDPAEKGKHPEFQLTNKERKKIRYWWTGSGKSCMSQSQAYGRLNDLCNRYCTLRLCSEDLQAYLIDGTHGSYTRSVSDPNVVVDTTTMTGGQRWASAMFNSQCIGPALNNLTYKAQKMQLQKICHILQVLDPIPIMTGAPPDPSKPKPLSLQLCLLVNGQAVANNTDAQLLGSDDQVFEQILENILVDAVTNLWEHVLSGTSPLNDKIQKLLLEEFTHMQAVVGQGEAQTARDKAVNMAGFTITQLRVMSQAMTIKGRKALDKLGQGGVRAFIGGGNTCICEAATLSQKTVTKAGLWMRGALAVAGMIGALVVGYGAFSNWKDLRVADRGVLITNALRYVGNIVEEGFTAFKSFVSAKTFPSRIAWAAFPEHRLVARCREAMDLHQKAEEVGHKCDDTCRNNARNVAELEEIEQAEMSGRGRVNSLDDPFKGGAGKVSERARLWSNLAKVGRFVMVVIIMALAVFVTIQLITRWGELHGAEFWLELASAVSIVLGAVADLFAIVAPALTAASAFLTWAGPALAIVGAILLLALFYIQKNKPPPLTKAEEYVKTLRDDENFKKLPDPPASLLTWTTFHILKPNLDGQTLKIQGVNAGTTDAQLKSASISINSGSTKNAIFACTSFTYAGQTTTDNQSSTTKRVGSVVLDSSDNTLKESITLGVTPQPSQTGDNGESCTPYAITLTSTNTANPQPLTIKPGQWITVTVTGTTGKEYSDGPYFMSIMEDWTEATNNEHIDVTEDIWKTTETQLTSGGQIWRSGELQ